MNYLLFKRLYAAGLAWLSQGLGMKGTSVKGGKTGMGWGNYMREMRGSQCHGNGYQWNREHRDKGWDKGDRDKWRGVGDVMEIEWTLGWKRCSGRWWSGMDLSEIHWWLISNSRPVLGGFLNLPLSMFRAFWFCSNKLLDTSICIHCLQWSYTVLFIIRFSADISWWKHFCFLAYGFLTLSLFCAWFRFIFLVRMSSPWLVKQLFNCLFIISWNSLMNSSLSALWLTSDKFSSSSVSSWSLAWSWGGSSAASQCCAGKARSLDSPVTSCLSGARHCRACSCIIGGVSSTCHGPCSHVLSGVSSTLLSSVTVPVMFQTLCAPAVPQ